ncbi:MAG: hypothetical protein ACI841_004143 [Planctomycetota bacterium]|jgi:hypothetical protein
MVRALEIEVQVTVIGTTDVVTVRFAVVSCAGGGSGAKLVRVVRNAFAVNTLDKGAIHVDRQPLRGRERHEGAYYREARCQDYPEEGSHRMGYP